MIVFLSLVCRFISYPRTETNIFPSSVDLNHLIQEQTHDPNWGGMVGPLALVLCGCTHKSTKQVLTHTRMREDT